MRNIAVVEGEVNGSRGNRSCVSVYFPLEFGSYLRAMSRVEFTLIPRSTVYIETVRETAISHLASIPKELCCDSKRKPAGCWAGGFIFKKKVGY